mgnify:CR=1 FL=1
MVNLEKIVDQLSTLTVMQAAELSKMLEEKWGVSAAAPAAAAPLAAAAEAVAEKTDFDIILVSSGDKKIEVIKTVREITGLGLKEAKELVDSAPKKIQEGIAKDAAEDAKKQIEAAGGKASLT